MKITKTRFSRRESAARFMAHAHTSVNVASRHYLSTERRYNYTTPKSFLEQISLYIRLLKTKASELRARVARLENGLDKLRSTAVQVDKLKKKLAVQEVELQQKNEAADALIAIVGVETEKVQKEKAIGAQDITFHSISNGYVRLIESASLAIFLDQSHSHSIA